MEPMEEDFLDVDDVANLLRIHRTTLHSWIRKDIKYRIENEGVDHPPLKKFKCPPYIRVGHKCRFLRGDIEKFMKELKGG